MFLSTHPASFVLLFFTAHAVSRSDASFSVRTKGINTSGKLSRNVKARLTRFPPQNSQRPTASPSGISISAPQFLQIWTDG